MHAGLSAAIRSPEPHPQRQKLSDGSVLVSRPTADCFGVTFGLFVAQGTRDEAAAEAGIAHLTEHMVFKGTERRSAFELVRDMEAIGAHLDAYTTKEYTAYTIRCTPEVFGDALAILEDMLLHSTFPEDQLEVEREVVLDELRTSEDAPEDHVHELFTAKLFGEHPLARPILGNEQTLRGIDSTTLRAYSQRAHRAGNIVLSAAGAVSERELRLIADQFSFPQGSVERPEDPAPQPAPGVSNVARTLGQHYVELGVPSVGAYDADRYVVGILSNILGGGMSSRLFQSVREERGLAYSIYSYGDFHRDTGVLGTSFSSAPQHVQHALDIVVREYERLRSGELDDAELEMNRAQLVGSLVLGLEGATNQMTRFARSEIVYGRFIPAEEILSGIESIRRADVIRMAKELLDPHLQTVVSFGPVESLSLR